MKQPSIESQFFIVFLGVLKDLYTFTYFDSTNIFALRGDSIASEDVVEVPRRSGSLAFAGMPLDLQALLVFHRFHPTAAEAKAEQLGASLADLVGDLGTSFGGDGASWRRDFSGLPVLLKVTIFLKKNYKTTARP